MKRTFAVILALMALAGAVYGAPKSKVKIALIIESTVDDKGWGQAMHDAIVVVQKKYGEALVEYNYSEKMKPVDAGSAARQYASRGFDVIIAHGAQFKNLVLELSEEFPKTTFAFGTNADVGPKNVFTYMPMSEETGYINGVIAGMVTKTGIIGVVGPVDAGDSARYDRGFWLGVKSVNPKADIKVAHTGSFADYVKAGELAQTHIKAGADVLTGPAGDRRPPRCGRVQGQADMVARHGHAAADDPRRLQGDRRVKLRLCTRHRDDDRQAPSRHARRGKYPADVQERRLHLQVQRQGRCCPYPGHPQGSRAGQGRHHRPEVQDRLATSQVLSSLQKGL